jgi:hypothetical protein
MAYADSGSGNPLPGESGGDTTLQGNAVDEISFLEVLAIQLTISL